MEAVEVALEAEIVLGPDAFQGTNEFFRTAIAFVMVQPWLADGTELALEPAGHDIDRHAALGELVDGRQLLGRQRRRPRPRQDRGNHLERFSGGQ